jgi:hypothetical protein
MSTHNSLPIDDVLGRIRAEYTEMPGLRVTPEQARRLWALDAATALRALDSLVEAGFLRRSGVHYVRVTEGPTRFSTGPRMTKAAHIGTPGARRQAS